MSSYQRAHGGWKMFLVVGLIVAWSAVGVARPEPDGVRAYRDERRGFALELPTGWRLTPRFGEAAAMVFERRFSARRGRRRAWLSVRRVPEDVEPDRVRSQLEDVWGAPIGEAPPRPAVGPPTFSVTVAWAFQPRPDERAAAYLAEASEGRFLVTLRSKARDRRRFHREAEAVLRTFRPLPVVVPGQHAPANRVEPSPPNLTGRWVRSAGAPLVLSADGSYRLADVRGRYRWQRGRLLLTRATGGQQVFDARVEMDRLFLSAPGWTEPLVFRRLRPEVELAGLWTARLAKGDLVLKLAGSGVFSLGAHNGRWSVEGRRLTLRKSKTEALTYEWEISNGVLTLSGGDLDRPLKLTRGEG